jgi:DNA-binding response OmpR family regulator
MDNAAMMVNDKDTGLVIRTALECAGFGTTQFDTTAALLRGIKRDDLRLIVIDVDGDSDGREPGHAGDWHGVLEWRRNWLNPGVVVIAVGRGDTQATVRALEAGVDDYVAKPVRGAELLARINMAVRRRSDAAGSGAVELCGCTVDRETCSLRSARSKVALTSRELGVVQILFENVGRPVTRQRLAAEVWGGRPDLSSRTIEQHVYQIRRKLRLCVGKALNVRSIYGCGYQLDLAASDAADGVVQLSLARPSAAGPRAAASAPADTVAPLTPAWHPQAAAA